MKAIGRGAHVYTLEFNPAGSAGSKASYQNQQGEDYELKVITPKQDGQNETKISKGTVKSQDDQGEDEQGKKTVLKPSNSEDTFTIISDKPGEMDEIYGTITFDEGSPEIYDDDDEKGWPLLPIGSNMTSLYGVWIGWSSEGYPNTLIINDNEIDSYSLAPDGETTEDIFEKFTYTPEENVLKVTDHWVWKGTYGDRGWKEEAPEAGYCFKFSFEDGEEKLVTLEQLRDDEGNVLDEAPESQYWDRLQIE